MRKLIIATEGQFHRDTECLDRHDRDRADSGADRDEDERVFLSVYWRDAVDHDRREDRHGKAVE